MSAGNSLSIYLGDHFAGSRLGIDLLETLASEHAGEPLGRFAVEMLEEIKADRDVLEELLERSGGTGPGVVKEGAAWLLEKMTWLKLRRGAGSGLGTLESLETLALGIHGKRALWRALAEVTSANAELEGIDFDVLIARADAQHARVEERRIEVARKALRASL